jgi:hypothetical protein
MVLQARHGLDMTEASGITIRNTHIVAEESNPVLNVHNSTDITLDKITYNTGAELLLNISGEKAKGIKLLHTDATKAKKPVTFTYGAQEGALTTK